MSLAAHRIRRLTWLVRTASESSAFAQRQALRAELESVLLPTLERVFDKYASSDQVLRIPKLMLRVVAEGGDTADLARHIEERLSQSIEEHLALRIEAPRARSTEGRVARPLDEQLANPDEVSSAPSDPGQPTREQDAPTSVPIPPSGELRDTEPADSSRERSLSGAEYRRHVLIEYLRSGRIGWDASTSETPALVAWLREEAERLVAEQPFGAGVLLGSLDARIAMSFRLGQLLTPATRDHWLRGVSLPAEDLLVALIQSAIDPEFDNYTRLRIAAVLFALRAEDVPTIRRQSAAQLLAAWSLPLAAGGVSASSQAIGGRGVDLISPSEAPPLNPSDRPPSDARHSATKSRRTEADRGGQRSQSDLPQPGASAANDDQSWRVRAMDPPPALDVPGVLAGDAGLILLHPFLPRLFEATGIVAADQRFLPAGALARAAALLHWLATGREDGFEFELSLSKVFLGFTPGDSFHVAEGLLSQGDRDEGDAMLAAVINHWSALRQTSLTGLRASFLQRRGILRDDERGWRLRMETESFDLLLGHLPWGINVVKLPWMTKPIFTDWPTP